MPRRNTLQILGALPRTNCRDCGLPTCLAFAAAVVAGDKALHQCPYLTPEEAEALGEAVAPPAESTPDPSEGLAPLKARVAELDLAEAARRLGGSLAGDRLRIHCLGRIFELDPRGELFSQCHVNRWVHFPLLTHLVAPRVRVPRGDWIPFRELRGAASWVRFYEHKCEGPLQALAEAHGDLLVDLLGVFGGRPPGAPCRDATVPTSPKSPGDLEAESDAHWSLLLHPLPRVPMLFLLWEAEEGFDAKLSLLWDRSAEDNLGPEGLYYLTSGMVEMLTRLVRRHAE